jgi:hypothetical protein
LTASSRNERLLPLLYLGGAVLFWGTSFVAVKTALGSFTPMTVIWLRMVIATLAFAPFARRLPRPDYRPGDWKVLLLAAVCIPCLYYLFEGYAILYTTSSQAGVISAIVPLLVAAGAWIFLHERLGWRGRDRTLARGRRDAFAGRDRAGLGPQPGAWQHARAVGHGKRSRLDARDQAPQRAV